jgi:hexosaminidase
MNKFLLFLAVAAGAAAQPVNVMPMPAKVAIGAGRLATDETFSIATTGFNDPRVQTAALRTVERLAKQTGIPIEARPPESAERATLLINCERAGAAVQKLGEEESYRLEITPAQARLTAPNALGVLRGVETFLQLVESDGQGFRAPVVTIEDKPRFLWRGLHMDVSRHWMPLDVVLRNLTGMAAVKLNVFHWHLSDDQGFRVESKRFPKLQELASDGHFYTQEQVREVLSFARDRGIRVVPEFDLPAHTTALLAAYPDLGTEPGPYEIGRTWGIFAPTMDPTKDAVYTFLDGFIGEMADLFPDEYFHIGGDEVNGQQWNASAHVQAFKKQHGLANNDALQAYFNQRLETIVTKHGKHMEGWDEILDPTLPKNIVIESWRGQKSLADAARQGYEGILSAGYYLDAMQPAEFHYQVDPLEKETAGLTSEQQARILGGEVCTWAEYLTPDNIDSRIWPRTAAIAERFWSPQEVRDIDSMYRRLALVSRRLESLGLRHASGYRLMLERLAGTGPLTPLQTLADVVSPVNLGGRARARKYTQPTPLNRLADAALPESETAREFSKMVDEALAGKRDRKELRPWLVRWRDNDARLKPAFRGNYLVAELSPLSSDLSRLGDLGLKALDALEAGRTGAAAKLTDQKHFLTQAAKPRAELRLMIVPSIQKLVDAASH